MIRDEARSISSTVFVVAKSATTDIMDEAFFRELQKLYLQMVRMTD